MAKKNNRDERLNKIREKIDKRAPIRRKKVEESNVDENTFLSEFFPVLIICAIVVGFCVFYFIFNNFKEILKVDNNGYFLSSDTLILGSKKVNENDDSIKTVLVNENDVVYKNTFNHFVEGNKKSNVNIEYPLFINDGLSIKNYNSNVNLINNNFDRSTGYEGLVFSYGKAFESFDYTQIDQEKYILLSYSDNVMINLYDVVVKTAVNSYEIPVNSFMYFEEDTISYYERGKDGFKYKVIKDVDFDSTIKFYYLAANEEYEYDYETFLKGIDTLYIKDFIIEEPVEPEKPIEKPEKPKPSDKPNVDTDEEFVWEKPSVVISDIKPNVYSLTAKLKVHDPAGVIVKAPTFTFYRNNKTFLRRTYYNSANMAINGLVGETTFTMTGTYTYLAEDMKTRIVVTFYSNKITTGSLDSLEPITLSFENGQIYPKMIEVKNVKVTSDLNAEAIKGVSKIGLVVGDKEFFLNNYQIAGIINGIDTTVTTPESLSSSSPIEYQFKFYDRENNVMKLVNSSGKTRTSKRLPNVSIRVKDTQIDSVTLVINQRNDDKIPLNNFIYVVTKSNGEVVKKEAVTSDTIQLTNLDPDQIFTVTLYADMDIDDGRGVQKNIELASVSFTSKPITTLGYINLNMEVDKLTHTGIALTLNINLKKTNSILVNLLKQFKVDIYDVEKDEIIRTDAISGERIARLKNGEFIDYVIDDLESNRTYKLVVTTFVQQGSTKYELGTTQGLDTFTTNKIPAMVYIENSFTTETMTDFDIQIEDVDGTIQSDFVRLEFRDKDKKIIDSRKISVNGEEPERITYNNLKTNEFYNIYVYADGYNETNQSSNYKSKYLLAERSIYTESGISGKIELISSLRVPTGPNIGDLRSEVKWSQMLNHYNVPKTTDEDGHMHIYSKTGASAYTYDLSEYHGEIVTVSFKARAINPTQNGKLYFTQWISGTTNGNYSKELTELNEDNFKSFTFTVMVGNYNSFTSMENVFPPVTDITHGKGNADAVGFYISGGTAEMSEYEIKDFEIHVQYNSSPYEYDETVVLEQGSWGTAVDYEKSKTDTDKRIRMSKPIFLEGGKRYRFDFDNDTTFTMYMYLFDAETGKYKQAYGWYRTGVSIYVPTDSYVRIMFRYRDEAGTIAPDDIKNFRIKQYVNNGLTGYTEFTYDLITKAKVTLNDKRDEITNDDYYIKVYENGFEALSFNYQELVETSSLENVIKDLRLYENKEYTVELGIMIRDRYYSLSSFEISTKDEVLGISTLSDWLYIQPYGNYILLNDLHFQDFTTQIIGTGYRYFHGVIDFQGYSMHQYTQKSDGTANDYYYRIHRIEEDAVLKNLVVEAHLNNQVLNGNVYGFVQYNYGTIENVVVNVHDTMNHEMPQKIFGLLTYYNGLKGKINNFVVNLNGGVHLYAESALLVRENYGTVSNGYMYGGNVIVDFALVSGSNRNFGVLTRYNGPMSTLQNVFSNISIEFPNNSSYDVAGILAYETYGKLKNAYVFGDTNPNYETIGPIVRNDASTAKYDNIYYLSKNIYTPTFQTKASFSSLYDKDFQYNVLGDQFNIDEMIELGFYPQLKYTSNKMPAQDYIELPIVEIDDYADIIYMNVIDSEANSANISVSINNPLGEEITDISITNLSTEIISQTYSNGKTELQLRVFNPSVYKSRYAVYSITSTSANGYLSTRKYDDGEKYLLVDLYKKISTVKEFTDINKGLDQNYMLMADLDLSGYSGFYINNFSGKFEGNNHVIKNINLTQSGKNGLFNAVYGTMQNVTFENVYKSNNAAYHAIVAVSNRYGKFYNVHVKNMTIEIGENVKHSNMYVGALIGNANQANISYCSATDVTIKAVSESVGMNAGGLVGYGYGMFITNSFAQNVNISVENSVSVNGIGGLVGREAWGGVGNITNSYATGSIYSNSAYVGGLVGQAQGYISDSWSSVDIVSDMSYLGGISGYVRQNVDVVQRSIYLGNMYSSSTDKFFHRINGNFESDVTNHVMSSNLINGVMSEENNGETILEYNDYLNAETYKNIFASDAYDLSKSSQGILPKLYAKDGVTLLPNQRDNYIYKNLFNVTKLRMDKHANSVTVTMYLDNPDNYEITGVEVTDAKVEIKRNASENGISVLEFEMTPELFFDSYRLSSLSYIDEYGEEVTIGRNIKIDAIFYKTLSTYDDWQKVSSTVAENYLLINNIDFKDKTKVKSNVMFNRLETPGGNLEYSLSNINLEFMTGGHYHALIQKVSTAISNIKFENITITDQTSGQHNNVNLIMYNYGSINNVTFNNVTIDAPNKYYVGAVGTHYGYTINDIELNNVTVNGLKYVASFIAYADNKIDDKYNNIVAKNITINSYNVGTVISESVGGIFGQFRNSFNHGETPVYTNFHISDSNINSNGKYVGGISGLGDGSYCSVDNTNVTGGNYVGGFAGYQRGSYHYGNIIKDSEVSGIDYYIGGLYGNAGYVYDSFAENIKVYGLNVTTYGVGGISGYNGIIQRCGVIDSVISNAGERTGGVIGYTSGQHVYHSFIRNSTVTSYDKAGGLVGQVYSGGAVRYNRVYDTNVIATNNFAGGIYGYFQNEEVYGSHNEGYAEDITLENVNVQAKYYAGGFMGGVNSEIFYPQRIRELFFEGTVNATSGLYYGLGSGDDHNNEVLRQPRIYAYERSLINGTEVKDMVKDSSVVNSNLLELVSFLPGYVNSNGSVSYNESDINASYSDFILLERGKTYKFKLDYILVPDAYQIYIYNTAKIYVTTINGGSAESYLGTTYTMGYNNEVQFTVYQDCYIRINITRKDRVKELTLEQIELPKGINKDNILNAVEMKEEITWGTAIGATSTIINSTKLNFTASHWDFSPINKDILYASVNDLTTYGHTASGKVSSLTSRGLVLSGYSENRDTYLKIPSYNIPNSPITLTSKFKVSTSRGYAHVFSSKNTEKKFGFGLFVHYMQLYVTLDNTHYATGYYIPYNTDVDVSVVYYDKTIIVYVNGEEVYRNENTRYRTIYTSYETFIGYDNNYAASNTSYRFIGTIYDLKLYNRALDENEIKSNLIYSGGITNSNGLELYYDFTKTNHKYTSYYPLQKYNANWEILNQELNEMPDGSQAKENLPILSSGTLNSKSLIDNYHIYSSGIDTINIEFDEISDDLSFVYKIKDKEYKVDVEDRVYTLYYDYVSDIEITINTAFESKTINLTSDDLSKKIMYKDNNYYVIDNKNELTKNDVLVINNAVHIYNNLVLLENGKVYDLNTNNTLNSISSNGVLSNSIPLKSFVLNNSIIKVYYNLTSIDDNIIDGQMFIKDGHVYMFNSFGTLNNNVVYNTYNTEEYQIVLNNDGSLKTYKASIKYPETFVNTNIKEISFDENSNEPVIMVRYDSGNILIFDYVNGSELFRSGEEMIVDIFDYLSSSLSNNTYSLGIISEEYSSSKNFIDSLNDASNNNVSDIINMYVSSSNETSNKLKTEYISVYNSNTNKFDIYNINDVVKGDANKVETYVDDKNNIVEKEKENVSNVISDSSPVSDKVKSNFVLYNYFYNRKSNSTIKEKREIIYIVIISLVVINLFILSYVYDRKEKANAK